MNPLLLSHKLPRALDRGQYLPKENRTSRLKDTVGQVVLLGLCQRLQQESLMGHPYRPIGFPVEENPNG